MPGSHVSECGVATKGGDYVWGSLRPRALYSSPTEYPVSTSLQKSVRHRLEEAKAKWHEGAHLAEDGFSAFGSLAYYLESIVAGQVKRARKCSEKAYRDKLLEQDIRWPSRMAWHLLTTHLQAYSKPTVTYSTSRCRPW